MRTLAIPRTITIPQWLPWALVGAALVAAFPRWTVDDAYISLRYARNLVEYGQLTWNVGEAPVEGYTGLIWTIMLAGALYLGIDPFVTTYVVGLFSLAACAWLTMRLVAQLGRPERQPLALALVVCSPCVIPHISGLETLLFAALVLASVLAHMQDRRGTMWALLLLTSLTRPEGVALALCMFALRDLRDWRMWAFYALPGAIYFWWRMSYYGDWLPNTFYAKSGGGGWGDVLSFLAVFILPACALWASRPEWTWTRGRGLLRVGVFISILILMYGRSELLMNYAHRFFVPIYLMLLVAMVLSLGNIRKARLYLVGTGVVGILTVAIYGVWCWHYDYMQDTEHAAAAVWIQKHAAPSDTLGVIVDAGMIPYQTGLRTIDYGALNDRYLARHPEPGDRVAHFFISEPDVVFLNTGDLGIRAAQQFRAALLADPRWSSHYDLAASFDGSRDGYAQQVWVRNATGLD